MRVLITGASGQLGSELCRTFEAGATSLGAIPEMFWGADILRTDASHLDITDACAVDAFVCEQAPDLIIDCAAMTDVDGCEVDRDLAFSVNAVGAQNLARASACRKIPIVYISTDYVFSGEEVGDRIESDQVAPLSVYGQSKAEGERLVADANPQHFIIRTAWLYGYQGSNFVKTMLHLSESREEVFVVDDQWGNPTNVVDLIHQALKIVQSGKYGIWHVTNEGTCSWADLARFVLADTDCKVRSCTSSEYKELHPKSADRPRNASLRNKRLEDTIGNEMRSWQDALADFLANYYKIKDRGIYAQLL